MISDKVAAKKRNGTKKKKKKEHTKIQVRPITHGQRLSNHILKVVFSLSENVKL